MAGRRRPNPEIQAGLPPAPRRRRKRTPIQTLQAADRRERARIAADYARRYPRRPRGGFLGALMGHPLEMKGGLASRFVRGGTSFALGTPAFAFELGKETGPDV